MLRDEALKLRLIDAHNQRDLDEVERLREELYGRSVRPYSHEPELLIDACRIGLERTKAARRRQRQADEWLLYNRWQAREDARREQQEKIKGTPEWHDLRERERQEKVAVAAERQRLAAVAAQQAQLEAAILLTLSRRTEQENRAARNQMLLKLDDQGHHVFLVVLDPQTGSLTADTFEGQTRAQLENLGFRGTMTFVPVGFPVYQHALDAAVRMAAALNCRLTVMAAWCAQVRIESLRPGAADTVDYYLRVVHLEEEDHVHEDTQAHG